MRDSEARHSMHGGRYMPEIPVSAAMESGKAYSCCRDNFEFSRKSEGKQYV